MQVGVVLNTHTLDHIFFDFWSFVDNSYVGKPQFKQNNTPTISWMQAHVVKLFESCQVQSWLHYYGILDVWFHQ